MKYLGDSFSVHPGDSKAYRDNFDKVFGKKPDKEDAYKDESRPAIPPPKDFSPEPVEIKKKPKQKKAKKRAKQKTKK